MSGWIFDDRGCQFESTLWSQLTGLLGSCWVWTTYHPITNGLVVYFHRRLKAALKGAKSLGRLTTIGTIGDSNRLQGGSQLHCSRVGLWDHFTSASRIFHSNKGHGDVHGPLSLLDTTQIHHAVAPSSATQTATTASDTCQRCPSHLLSRLCSSRCCVKTPTTSI